MADITIRVLGAEALTAKLNKIAGDIRPTLKKAMTKSMQYVHSAVPPYPGAPAGSRYRRTGTLGRATTTRVEDLGASVVGIIGNAVEYAPWVISETEAHGAGPQAGFHRGRWYTLQGVVRGAFAKVVQIHEEFIKALLR